MPANTKIQVRRGTSQQWVDADAANRILSQGEFGYDTEKKRFKIGDGNTSWATLPWAGGSDINPGSGIALYRDSSTNTYYLHSPLASGNNINLSSYSINGDGTTAPSGSGFSIGLRSNITGITSIINSVSNNTNYTSGPASGQSIVISGYSGVFIHGGSGRVTTDDLFVNGELILGGGVDITLVSDIYARGPITYSGDPNVFKGNTYFTNTPFVGPSGGTLGTNLFPVSLSGHNHVYSDVTNFSGGVATYVDTALVVSTGLRADYVSNSLQLALSGQASTLHRFTGSGLLVRTAGPDNNGTFAARSISEGSNISVSNGNGIAGNPTVSLNTSLTGLSNVKSTNLYTSNIFVTEGENTLNIQSSNVNISGNLTAANLTVTGTTTTVNSTTITVQDPVITLGGTGIITGSDTMDRGLQLRYWDGSAANTGFIGWNYQTSEFIFLSSTTGLVGENDKGAGTFGQVRVGSLFSAGTISGTNVYATNQTAHRLAVFDANKMLASTGISTLELSYLSGVSSNIQTQLDNKVPSSRTITAGSGLANGGSLGSDIQLDIGQGDGISVSANSIAVDNTVVRTTGGQTISGVKTFANTVVFQSGLTSSGSLSAQSAASSGPNSFAVFDLSPTGSSVTISSRTLSNVRSDLGTSTNTGDRLVLRDSNGDFSSRYITVTGLSGVQTNVIPGGTSVSSIYTSTSISGINNTTYLLNFIVDGGTP